ncbi:MAG TPA: hypothetical protein VHS09_02715, partial [Polyangiaceae bacterium]|nr:hypothetical protein [Polyangiaceae bacterium]
MSSPGFEVRQEEDAVASRSLVRIGIVSGVVGVAGVLVAWALLGAAVGSTPGRRPRGPAPRELSGIEQDPIRDTRAAADLQAAQRRELEGWGWVDRDAGVAHIPIDRAM